MSHPYGAHDYTIHITNANLTHEFIFIFCSFLLFGFQKFVLQSWIQAVLRMYLVFLDHLIISRTAPQVRSKLHKTYDLRSWFSSMTLRFAREIFLFQFFFTFWFMRFSPSPHLFFRVTSEPVPSDPLCLPSNELLSYFITNRQSQNDCTVSFRSFVMFANCWISFAVFIDLSFLVSTISPDYSHWFCLSQPHPDNPMRKNFCISTIRP